MKNLMTGKDAAKTKINKFEIKDSFLHRENVVGYAFIAPWLIGFFAFTLIPILASLYFSFTNYDLLSAPKLTGLDNYVKMFTNDPKFFKSMGTTLIYVATAVPLRLAFALAVAMIFTYKTKFEGLYRAIYYLPSLVGGSVAIAVLWRRLFDADGIFNAVLSVFGVHSHTNWLGNPNTSLWTLVLLFVWQFGSPMLIFLAGLKQIPAELYEAANADGAKPVQKFFRITFPMLTPIIFFNLIMQIITGFTIFTQSFIISNGTGAPLDSLLLYSLYLYRRAFVFFDMGYGCAMAWVLLLVVALTTVTTFATKKFWVYDE